MSLWIRPLVAALSLPPGLSVDLDRSELLAFVKPDSSRLFSGLSHEHVLRATNWRMSLELDPDEIETCRLELVVPVQSLVVDEADLRARFGWPPIADGDRRRIRDAMLAEDQLHAARYPEIRFVADHCRAIDGDSRELYLRGQLTIRGQAEKTGVYVRLAETKDGLFASGDLSFSHRQFGFEPYSAAFGTIRNADVIRVTFSVVLQSLVATKLTPSSSTYRRSPP